MDSYDKALKKLAGQIVRTIKDDTTYRNIPFGDAQLDIHSDGKIVLLAVKVLDFTKNSFNVREFQMPLTKLRKFLMGSEMRRFINNSDMIIISDDRKILKQISQGIAEIVYDSKAKKETWVFPFHNRMIVFKKEVNIFGFDGLVGRIAFLDDAEINSNVFHSVSGLVLRDCNDYAKKHFTHMSIEFRIYRFLTTRNGNQTDSNKDYQEVSDSFAINAV